jgi:3-hydroxymyristoyl/3-hydroxydecanoyl-(acyl carrier protein) dehydratase
MREVHVPRAELDSGAQAPVLFDALIGEEDHACVFVKTVTEDDPGVAEQRTTPRWPHHLPGELIIALTGQAGGIALRRQGLIDPSWRGHGVRIRDARFSAPVLLGERFYVRVETLRVRRLLGKLHARFRFRMWKDGPGGSQIETYRSEQDALFFPG